MNSKQRMALVVGCTIAILILVYLSFRVAPSRHVTVPDENFWLAMFALGIVLLATAGAIILLNSSKGPAFTWVEQCPKCSLRNYVGITFCRRCGEGLGEKRGIGLNRKDLAWSYVVVPGLALMLAVVGAIRLADAEMLRLTGFILGPLTLLGWAKYLAVLAYRRQFERQ